MRYNKHYLRSDTPHAVLSASNYSWINYDDEKLVDKVMTMKATQLGTELHAIAANLIKHNLRMEDIPQTLNMYVNDCVGFRMQPELILYVNEYCFGTADAFRFSDPVLKIFDLKTGVNATSFKQLLVYAAMFCLEYSKNPFDLQIELRIYQNNEMRMEIADPDEVTHIMAQITWATKLINKLNEEEAK